LIRSIQHAQDPKAAKLMELENSLERWLDISIGRGREYEGGGGAKKKHLTKGVDGKTEGAGGARLNYFMKKAKGRSLMYNIG